jgi:hypothetical protein
MKKRIKGVKKSNIYFSILIFIIVMSGVYYFYKIHSSYTTISSSLLDLSIKVPSKYVVNQQFGTIIIENQNSKITIDRYGSFFNNLDKHLEYLSEKNNVKIDILEKYDNNFYKVRFNHPENPRPQDISYIILNEYTVHTFVADSEELYTDLDAIAKSFRYNP